jgi:prepilin-type N-terminal cleavage/methylation domain-containing protein
MDKLTAAIDGALNYKRLIAGGALSAGLVIYYEVFMRYSFFAKDIAFLKVASQRGFTLIEVLLVVGIISFLATMVAVQVFRSGGEGNVKIAKAGVKMVSGLASQYFMDTARSPTSMDDLLGNERAVLNWRGPYLTPSQDGKMAGIGIARLGVIVRALILR